MNPADDVSGESRCSRCEQALDPTDRFCRACGVAVDADEPWYQGRGAILFLLFLGVGPLALPLLLKSAHFSQTEKIVVAVLNVGFFVGLVWALVQLYLYMVNTLIGAF